MEQSKAAERKNLIVGDQPDQLHNQAEDSHSDCPQHQ